MRTFARVGFAAKVCTESRRTCLFLHQQQPVRYLPVVASLFSLEGHHRSKYWNMCSNFLSLRALVFVATGGDGGGDDGGVARGDVALLEDI